MLLWNHTGRHEAAASSSLTWLMLWIEEALLVQTGKQQIHRQWNKTVGYHTYSMRSHICRTIISYVGGLDGSTKTNKLKGNTRKQHMTCNNCTSVTWLLVLFVLLMACASVLPFNHSWCHHNKNPGMLITVTLTWTQSLVSFVTVCSQLCTKSWAAEGLGGTAGGAFVISTWVGPALGVCFGARSGTLGSTVPFEDSGCFRFSGPKLTENEAVCVEGGDRVGPFWGARGVCGGEPVVLVWGSR